MPKLPDGYFWRISRGSISQYTIVEIRKQGWWIFSTQQAWSVATGELSDQNILSTAQYVLEKFNVPKDNSRFYGDYPPKNLKEIK
jgi:hypothetical protein